MLEQAAVAPGRRARKKAQTRRNIYDAATALVLARGYDAVTVDDVCRAADVAKGTFFLHVPTKDALLAEYGRLATEELQPLVESQRGSATSAIRSIFRALSARAERHAELVRLTVRETMARPVAMAQSTAQGRTLGELRRGVVPEVAGAVLVGAYFAIVNAWAADKPSFDLSEAVDHALKIVLQGLRKE